MELWSHFQQNTGKIIYKPHHYFPIYEKHLSSFQNKQVTIIEIGVFKGGSLEMFAEYLGPLATVVGVDIDEGCKKHETDFVKIRIGDQSDTKFLESLIEEFGPPDIVIDDGSHQMHDLRKTFDYLYPRVSKNGLYIAEDVGTSYWQEFGGGLYHEDSFIEYSKSLIDQLNYEVVREAIPSPQFIRDTKSITFYHSVVVFEKGTITPKVSSTTGVE